MRTPFAKTTAASVLGFRSAAGTAGRDRLGGSAPVVVLTLDGIGVLYKVELVESSQSHISGYAQRSYPSQPEAFDEERLFHHPIPKIRSKKQKDNDNNTRLKTPNGPNRTRPHTSKCHLWLQSMPISV
jgi:hypothetical protein